MENSTQALWKNILNLQIIEDLNRCAQKMGVKLYFVGGIVRDFLMGVKIKDIDIVVEGDAIAFCKSYEGIANAANSVNESVLSAEIISTHPDFGTCKMKIGGTEIDFASTREEVYPQSGCLPIVRNIGCSLKNDVLRRDFTINSIAIDLLSFKIVDYLGGAKDIDKRVLKILHPKSFIDDPTRILRALDFSLRLGFKIDDETKKLQLEFLHNFAAQREYLSISRVDLTLRKLFLNHKTAQNAYKKIIDEKLYKIFQDEAPKIDPGKLQKAMEIFEADSVETYFRAVKNEIIAKKSAKNNYEIFKCFKDFSNADLAIYYALNNDDNAVKFMELKNIKIEITGDDIIKLGINQGPKIGEILEKLLEIKLNSPKTAPRTLKEEIDWVKRNFL